MALHGTLKVNGEVIGGWSARRIEPDVRPVNSYDCRLELANITRAFTVEHRYSDGAATLAAKVLGRDMGLYGGDDA